jgi:hypothetical protein
VASPNAPGRDFAAWLGLVPKGPQAVCIPLARHLSKLCEHLTNVTAVAPQRGIASPALQAHPLAVSRQER